MMPGKVEKAKSKLRLRSRNGKTTGSSAQSVLDGSLTRTWVIMDELVGTNK